MRALALLAAVVLVSLLTACSDARMPEARADEVSTRILELQLDEHQLLSACSVAISEVDHARMSGTPANIELGPCLKALPLVEGAALIDLLRKFAPYSTDEMRLPLLLELASRTNDGADQQASGQALLEAAGFADGKGSFDAVDPDAFWAARGAIRLAAAAGQSGADQRVRLLESFEFPLGERMAHRDEFLNVYFRRWPQDTIATRRMLAGFAIGWRDICTQWETGMTSVQYSRGLAALLAPIRAEIPGRLLETVPTMGRRAMDAASGAIDAGLHNGAAGVINQGLLGWNGIKRDFDAAVAVASASGRDAGIAVYQSVGNCRTPRALRLVDSMIGAFEHYAPLTPVNPGSTTPPAPAIDMEPSR